MIQSACCRLSRTAVTGRFSHLSLSLQQVPARYFSNGDDDDKTTGGKTPRKDDTEADADPFGVHFEDGDERLGPDIPPKYKRDTMTGKFTGEKEAVLTDKKKKLLNPELNILHQLIVIG